MNKSKNIDLANPFIGFDSITESICDIKNMCTKIVHMSDNGIVVSLPNNDTLLLSNIPTDNYQVGDFINIYIDNEGCFCLDDGLFEINKKVLIKAKENQPFIGEIIEAEASGLIVSIDGLNTFLPEGQLGESKHRDLQMYVGEKLDVKLIAVKLKEKGDHKINTFVSRKIIEDEKNLAIALRKLQEIKVGDIIPGKVKNITSYGAFVTLFPSVEGLIHIKDLSWNQVSNPSEVVYIGQMIDVVVLDIRQIDNGHNQISLGLKQLTPKPWENFDKNTKIGDIVSGKVCSITGYGIFVRLPCGVEGMVHKTELSWDKNIVPTDFVKKQSVTAMVMNIDWEAEKLLLSIKQTLPDPWNDIKQIYSVGDILDVTIKDFAKYGVFVRTHEGYEGFIHISELSWTNKIKKPKNHFQLGCTLKVIITKIDLEKKGIEFSLKRILPNPWLKYQKGQSVKAVIKTKDSSGLHALIKDDNLPALIPANQIPLNMLYNEGIMLDCIVKDVYEDSKIVILDIE